MQAKKTIARVQVSVQVLIFGWLFICNARPCFGQTGLEKGQGIFEEKCIECHTLGDGALVGPDLKNVTERRDKDWLVRFITAPEEMLSKDPLAQKLLQEFDNVSMPDQGLSHEDAVDIVAFLRDSSGAPGEALAPAPPDLTLEERVNSGRWGLLAFFLVIAFTIVFVFGSVAYSTKTPSEVNLQQALRLRRAIFFSLVAILLVFLGFTIFEVPYFPGLRNPDSVVYLTLGQFRVATTEGLITNREEWSEHLGKGATFKKGETVEFRITSVDVNHGAGFYDPNGQIVGQTQAMPGYVNRLSLKLEKPGVYTVLCLEYCGPAHHVMKAAFRVE